MERVLSIRRETSYCELVPIAIASVIKGLGVGLVRQINSIPVSNIDSNFSLFLH